MALISGKVVNSIIVLYQKKKLLSQKLHGQKLRKYILLHLDSYENAGDDPDITHGAEICSTVSFTNQDGKIVIDGGMGVGRITKPGLGLEIGKAADQSSAHKNDRTGC